MERRVQFSQTFDYYERPGIKSSDMKKLDREMQHKWSGVDQDEELGGLAAEDIPGASKLDVHTEQAAESQERAIRKAAAAIAKINKRNAAAAKTRKVEKDHELKEAMNRVTSTKVQSDKLWRQSKDLAGHVSQLTRRWSQADMDLAKLSVGVAEAHKKSRAATRKLRSAIKRANEYAQAYKAYRIAGNPAAKRMRAAAQRWQKSVVKLKTDVLRLRSKRLAMQGRLQSEKDNVKEMKNEAAWAKSDYRANLKKEKAMKKLHKMAKVSVHRLENSKQVDSLI